MANTIHTDSQEQSVTKGGGSSSKWGRLLFTVETDRKRIGLEILIRAAVSVFAVFLSYSRGNGLVIPTLVLFALFCRGCFLPITWLNVGGTTRRINVSFMKDAEKLFNRAYNNAIYEKGREGRGYGQDPGGAQAAAAGLRGLYHGLRLP